MDCPENLESELKELRDTFNSGITKQESWRRSQLKALLSLLEEKEDDIAKALEQDLGKHPVESFRDEVGPLIKSVNYALKGLKRWMSSKKVDLPIAAFPSRSELVPEPLGVILVISCWNFPFGSAKVARIVMTAAAINLTPVAVELGGKCPAIVDSLSSSWDKEIAMKRILAAKFGTCAGQACIAIDYILVERKFSATLVNLLKGSILRMFGENPKELKSVGRIINKNHCSRLRKLLDETGVKASIVHGGSYDEDSLFMEPTLLVDPPLNAGIMTEEIFGPLLPIITVEKLEDSIEFIKSRPKSLAIYAFTNNETLKKKLVSETSSGSVTFNDAIIQYVADTLPFGGVGESGFGRYHGKFSFDAFTHEKPVVLRSFLTDFWFRYPPWNGTKLQIFKSAYRFHYFEIILILLGMKRS